eukprot:gene11471-11565_t
MNLAAIRKLRGLRIKQQRIEKKLTQDELAKISGVDRKTIMNMESGENSWNNTFRLPGADSIALVIMFTMIRQGKQHGDQKRKYTGDPYVNHLIAVAEMADGRCEFGWEIGLCHDLFEDTTCNLPDLYEALQQFGYDEPSADFICDRVDDLTDVYTAENSPELNRKHRKHLEALRLHYIHPDSQTDEFYALSDHSLELKDEVIKNLLMQYFLSPFQKTNEVYNLIHSTGNLALNEVHHFATEIFENKDQFHEVSQQIAKHLFKIEGELMDVIGIFKSENKETYLKIYPETGGFQFDYEQNGININKLDKGVLIFNSQKEKGYKVVVIDKTNGSPATATYWKDEFLQLRIRNDSFNQTSNALGIYKNFVTQKLDDEFEMSKADKIDLLNRSMKYFKEKDTFDMDEFTGEVIGNEKAIESFKNFKSQYEQEFDSPIPDTFEISDNAVKKQARVYKSVLKLDKNFEIIIHGDKSLIEKGFDLEKHLNYYKVYFKEEA